MTRGRACGGRGSGAACSQTSVAARRGVLGPHAATRAGRPRADHACACRRATAALAQRAGRPREQGVARAASVARLGLERRREVGSLSDLGCLRGRRLRTGRKLRLGSLRGDHGRCLRLSGAAHVLRRERHARGDPEHPRKSPPSRSAHVVPPRPSSGPGTLTTLRILGGSFRNQDRVEPHSCQASSTSFPIPSCPTSSRSCGASTRALSTSGSSSRRSRCSWPTRSRATCP